MGSHICCENLFRNFKLSVVGRESHRKTRSRLCADPSQSQTLIHICQKQTTPQQKGCNEHKQYVTQEEIDRERGILYHPNSSEIEVNTFDQQKDACSDPDQLCDSALGFHRNMRATTTSDLNILNSINRRFLERLKDDEVSQSGMHHFI